MLRFHTHSSGPQSYCCSHTFQWDHSFVGRDLSFMWTSDEDFCPLSNHVGSQLLQTPIQHAEFTDSESACTTPVSMMYKGPPFVSSRTCKAGNTVHIPHTDGQNPTSISISQDSNRASSVPTGAKDFVYPQCDAGLQESSHRTRKSVYQGLPKNDVSKRTAIHKPRS